MISKILKLITFIIVFHSYLLGQSYHFEKYSVEEGLHQSQVYVTYQDSKGYLWIGTNGGGVSRYDGKQFVKFDIKNGLSSNIVFSVVEDSKGNLYFGTDKGLSQYNGKNFITYNEKKGLNGNSINSLIEDNDGRIWIGTNVGLSVLDGENIINYSSKNGFVDKTVWELKTDNHGNIWIIVNGGNLYSYNNDEFSNLSKEIPGLDKIKIYSIEIDKNNLIWFGTNKGLVQYNGLRVNILNNPQDEINYIVKDDFDNIWLGTWSNGVYKYDGKSFSHFNTTNGLSSNNIMSINIDRESNIWIGTDGRGVLKYSHSSFITYVDEKRFGDQSIWGIEEDINDNILLGSYGGGMTVMNKTGKKSYTKKDGLISNLVLSLLTATNGDIWIGTEDGISRFDGNKFENISKINNTDDIDNIYKIIEDSNNNIWFTKWGLGVIKYDGKDFMIYNKNNGLNSNYVNTVVEDSAGIIWFGTEEGLSTLEDGELVNYPSDQFDLRTVILSLVVDKNGDLWFGTSGEGIYKLNNTNGKNKFIIDSFTSDNGLSDDEILSLIFDNDGNLWCGTNRGINKIVIDRYNESGEKKIVSYKNEEGFSGIECNHNSAYKDSEGNLWFGTIKGVIEFDPRNVDKKNKVAPLTHITGIKMLSEEFDWTEYSDGYSNSTGLPENLSLPYYLNHLTFDFIGISLKIPEKVQYKFILEGFDKDWPKPIYNNSVSYTNLPPGEYVFKVQASNSDGLWNEDATSFSFNILPPFWQTWWFSAIVILLLISIVYLIIKLRVRFFEMKQKDLEKKF